MVILVVDSDSDSAANLKRCIKSWGKDVELKVFSDSSLALEYIKKHEVNMLFTEVNMHAVSGFALTKCLKEKTPNAYVVFVTQSEEYAMHAWEAHVNGYLLKPVDSKRVQAELDCVSK